MNYWYAKNQDTAQIFAEINTSIHLKNVGIFSIGTLELFDTCFLLKNIYINYISVHFDYNKYYIYKYQHY